jgi:hypothetical protein
MRTPIDWIGVFVLDASAALAQGTDTATVATRRSEGIADVGSLTLASQQSVPWMGLDETEAPLVARDVSTNDLYALDWEAP